MINTNSDTYNHPDSATFVADAGRLLTERHCEDVVILDVKGLSQVCDFVLIATGTSDRQMKSVASELASMGKEVNFPAFRKNIDTGATWIVVDFISVVAHLFEPERRAYYDLEDLWADAKRIEIPTQTSTPEF